MGCRTDPTGRRCVKPKARAVMIETNGDTIMLEIVHSVYKNKIQYEKLADGELYPQKTEVLQKQMRVKKWFKKECITSVEEYVTSKNTIAKNRSIVFDKYSSRFYVTYHKPEEVLSSIGPYKNQIGFTYDTKIHPAGTQVFQHKKRG
jgi:hypothetical protein